MRSTMHSISVRIPQLTLDLLDRLTTNSIHLDIAGHPDPDARPYNRSELIRHALTAGLDAITRHTPKRNQELEPCQSSTPPLPTILADQDSDSSAPLPGQLSLPMS